MAKQLFSYQFKLDEAPGGTYAVQDAQPGSSGTQAFAADVTIRSTAASGKVLGDQDGEFFRVGTGKAAQVYTFLGNALDGAGNPIGIIAEREGQRFLFTEQQGLQSGNTLSLQTPKADGSGQWSLAKEGPLCFMPGTLVATPTGERLVEGLRAGDEVLTAEGMVAKVRWIGRQTFSRHFGDPARTLPVRIRAGALGDGLPRRDLRVSPDHALMLDGLLVQAGALVNGVTVLRDDEVPESFTYFHVELADHSLILAEGVPAETFIDNVGRMAFDNWAEHEAAGEIPAPMTELALPRVRSARQLPASLRARLGALSEAA